MIHVSKFFNYLLNSKPAKPHPQTSFSRFAIRLILFFALYILDLSAFNGSKKEWL